MAALTFRCAIHNQLSTPFSLLPSVNDFFFFFPAAICDIYEIWSLSSTAWKCQPIDLSWTVDCKNSLKGLVFIIHYLSGVASLLSQITFLLFPDRLIDLLNATSSFFSKQNSVHEGQIVFFFMSFLLKRDGCELNCPTTPEVDNYK